MNVAVVPPQVHPAFELLQTQPLPALKATLTVYRHRRTGARHYHLATDHDENVFVVAFRTQPMDSTGIAHILEHTALCGSRKYPVRDPFFSMIRRSLNTFMNAFTAADWTAYPFASQNRKDYFNLLSVYLDAAFFANLDELDFAQEGIRVELDEQDKPVYKGIVFNEMKGAMASPTDQLYHQMAHHLYPETTYHYNSGGNPADIPSLTHADLKAFHAAHYHPSNAIFMTFGNIPPVELQAQFESQALHAFDGGTCFEPTPEKRLTAPVAVEATYAVDDADLTSKTHLVLGWLLPPSTDSRTRLALNLLDGVLTGDSASPLQHYLETCGLGQSPSPLVGLDDGNYEMAFYAGVQGSEPEQAAALEAGVLAVLQQVAEQGVDPEIAEAVLHQMELRQREITGDQYPYGLQLLLTGLGSAIQGGDPLSAWDIESQLAELREQIRQPGFIGQLIRTHLLNNPHRVRLTLRPDPEQSQREQAAEQARLDELAATLTAEGRQQLREQAQRLKARQEQQDDIDLLPKVGLEDVAADMRIAEGQTSTLGGTGMPLHCYEAGANGLYYQQILVPLSQQILQSPWLALYCGLFGEVGAGEMDYLVWQQQQTATVGNLFIRPSIRGGNDRTDTVNAWLVLGTKALVNRPQGMNLLHDSWIRLRLDEHERIRELLTQQLSRWQSRLPSMGSAYAAQAAARTYSAQAAYDFERNGIAAFQRLRQLVRSLDQPGVLENWLAEIKTLHAQVLQQPRHYLLVAEPEQMQCLTEHLAAVWQNPASQPDHVPQSDQVDQAELTEAEGIVTAPVILNTADAEGEIGWILQTNVQACVAAYAAVPIEHPDAPPLMVLGSYLRNGFLHRALREQGGAYGGGASYDPGAAVFRFSSYRDPRLQETFADFQASIYWLLEAPQQPHQLEEAILGLMGSMDKPGSPAGEAISACVAGLQGRKPDKRRALRQAILAVTLADLQRVARQYLLEQPVMRSVAGSPAREADMQALGLEVRQVTG